MASFVHDSALAECLCKACCIARASQIANNGLARTTALVEAGQLEEAARECGARTPAAVEAWIAANVIRSQDAAA